MSMQITSQAATRTSFFGASAAERMGKTQARRESFQELSQALQSGDLNSARSAYASLAKNAPAAASWRPDSAFAQLGKALIQGDMGAAQSAFDTMAANIVKARNGTPPADGAPADVPASSNNGSASTASTGLSLVA